MSASDAVDGCSTRHVSARLWARSMPNGHYNRSRLCQVDFSGSTALVLRAMSSLRRQFKRRRVPALFQKLPPCLIGIEACASSHHWSRELQALGHTVRLMPPAYVKPYVKRHKNDATDAADRIAFATCEARR